MALLFFESQKTLTKNILNTIHNSVELEVIF